MADRWLSCDCVALLILQPCLILLNGCEWIRLSTNFITNKHHAASASAGCIGLSLSPFAGLWPNGARLLARLFCGLNHDSFCCRCKWRDPIRLRLFASVPARGKKNTTSTCGHYELAVVIAVVMVFFAVFSAAYFAFGRRLGEKKITNWRGRNNNAPAAAINR